MPRVESSVPELLQPYLFHGLDLSWDDRHALGDCPFCGREGKWDLSLDNGLWTCRVAGCRGVNAKGGGNLTTFLRSLWEAADGLTTDYGELAEDRGLLPETLVQWGLVRSPLTGDWLVPGHDREGHLRQLYRYARGPERMVLLPTPGVGHHLFGAHLVPANTSVIYICEGPWDAMALWEALGRCKPSEGGLVATSNADRSLRAGAGVVGVPGCSTFLEAWQPLFKGREAVVMYDSDHPRVCPTGQSSAPAGWAGTRRAAGRLLGFASSVRVLRWGEEGYDPELPSGHDVRDELTSGDVPGQLEGLLARVVAMPEEWAADQGGEAMECRACRSYRTLTTAWRKALRWTEGLDHALSCMLACIASTPMVGDQLWLKVVGPAACGKSTLCEAVSVCHEYVLAKSTIRGFHSGFKEQGGDGEDHSLLKLLPGKTLVTKDGDTLLQSPNLPQILSEGRDVYDGVSRTHYRNAMSKDYDGLRVTWILCGTSSLRQIDSSELGERFLDCVLMGEIDDELEDEILDRVVHRAARDVAVESDGEVSRHYAPEMAAAMSLTGGYVRWLRENAVRVLAATEYPREAKRRLTRLGKFVAHMRARPSLKQEEVAEREFASRLVSQLTRLAGCLALTLNRPSVDEEVMRRVRQVAMDTSRGRTLTIVAHLRDEGEVGMLSSSLAMLAGQTEDKTRTLLRFLRAIGVVESHQPAEKKGRVHWRLTSRMRRLYDEVHD